MTVAELIEKLKTFPQDALVVTEGYEDGYDTFKKISLIAIEINPKKDWWVGQYMDSENPNVQQAVFLDAQTKADNI